MTSGFNWTPSSISKVIQQIEDQVGHLPLPSVSLIGEQKRDPFKILISTIISLRTKDQVTTEASLRLFDKADTPAKILNINMETIAGLIYPAAFFKRKSETIHKICKILLEQYNGAVPNEQNQLLALPGVGVKTANLTLSLGFGLPFICVDTHVHRIANRLGWVRTATAEETDAELPRILPKKHWIRINELLVLFGQNICRPQSPFCSQCSVKEQCPAVGVTKKR